MDATQARDQAISAGIERCLTSRDSEQRSLYTLPGGLGNVAGRVMGNNRRLNMATPSSDCQLSRRHRGIPDLSCRCFTDLPIVAGI